MMKIRISKHSASLVLALGALGLSGCSSINQALGTEESINYKSTQRGDPLAIPPDLTQANRDPRYRAPEGTTTFTQYAQNQQQAARSGAANQVLPTLPGVQVMRDGDLRWLVVQRPAEQVYPKILEFWVEQGFTVASQDPQAGVVQTDWAENRAKIPEDWIRGILGSVIDTVYDSGERERFRTRLERVNGTTEVYISHQQMVETPSGDDTTFKWVMGPEDPGLNAAMLARLMVYLGTDVERAKELVSQAERAPNAFQAQQVSDQSVLVLNEPFDRAWRRVGVAIDSAGFNVEDRDRSAGDYFVRYLDSDTGQVIEQQNFFGRLFGGRNTAEAPTYRIHVAQQGSGSVVSVLDSAGVKLENDTAKRILAVLMSSM